MAITSGQLKASNLTASTTATGAAGTGVVLCPQLIADA